jgi:hypothetical protein
MQCRLREKIFGIEPFANGSIGRILELSRLQTVEKCRLVTVEVG